MVEIIIQLVDWMTANPVFSLIIFSGIITFISTMVTKWLTNQEHLRSMKERQKQIQKDLRNHKPGEKVFEELQNEMLQISMIMMKSSFKPMLVTLIPFLLLFTWLKKTYDPILHGWIWYYIGFSLGFSILYRKALNMA